METEFFVSFRPSKRPNQNKSSSDKEKKEREKKERNSKTKAKIKKKIKKEREGKSQDCQIFEYLKENINFSKCLYFVSSQSFNVPELKIKRSFSAFCSQNRIPRFSFLFY